MATDSVQVPDNDNKTVATPVNMEIDSGNVDVHESSSLSSSTSLPSISITSLPPLLPSNVFTTPPLEVALVNDKKQVENHNSNLLLQSGDIDTSELLIDTQPKSKPKRKRGRPKTNSRNQSPVLQSGNTNTFELPIDNQPERKRGRPKNSKNQSPAVDKLNNNNEKDSTRRNKPRKKQQVDGDSLNVYPSHIRKPSK